eukprot:gene716-887_t
MHRYSFAPLDDIFKRVCAWAHATIEIKIMKKGIHPAYREVVFLDTTSNSKFLTRSTLSSKEKIQWENGQEYPLIKIEISADSHPFYTGKKIFVDTAENTISSSASNRFVGGVPFRTIKTGFKVSKRLFYVNEESIKTWFNGCYTDLTLKRPLNGCRYHKSNTASMNHPFARSILISSTYKNHTPNIIKRSVSQKHEVNPFEWLSFTLKNIPSIKYENIRDLYPHNFKKLTSNRHILGSCGSKENSNHIPNKGSGTLEEQPTAEALERLYREIGIDITNAVSGIGNCLKHKSVLNKRKEEFYKLRSENKNSEKILEKETIDRKLEELKEGLKQIQEEFSTKISLLSLQNPKIKPSQKYLDFHGFKMLKIWREAEETTEEYCCRSAYWGAVHPAIGVKLSVFDVLEVHQSVFYPYAPDELRLA